MRRLSRRASSFPVGVTTSTCSQAIRVSLGLLGRSDLPVITAALEKSCPARRLEWHVRGVAMDVRIAQSGQAIAEQSRAAPHRSGCWRRQRSRPPPWTGAWAPPHAAGLPCPSPLASQTPCAVHTLHAALQPAPVHHAFSPPPVCFRHPSSLCGQKQHNRPIVAQVA